MDEFHIGLELTTTEELEGLTSLLFQRRFNPLDYAMRIDDSQLPFDDRQAWLQQVDQRFRFLAADGITVLKRTTKTLPYRQILIAVCKYFKLPLSPSLSTLALEEEVFLHLIDLAYQRLPPEEQSQLEHYFRKALMANPIGQQFCTTHTQHSLRLVLKGSSAVMLSSVIRPLILRHMASQVAVQLARYQMTKQVLAGSSTALLSAAKHQAALKIAQRGLAFNVARYSAIRGVFSILGPAMWTWFLADLGWRAIATNYGRIIPVIFSIAQIRLLRGDNTADNPSDKLGITAI